MTLGFRRRESGLKQVSEKAKVPQKSQQSGGPGVNYDGLKARRDSEKYGEFLLMGVGLKSTRAK